MRRIGDVEDVHLPANGADLRTRMSKPRGSYGDNHHRAR